MKIMRIMMVNECDQIKSRSPLQLINIATAVHSYQPYSYRFTQLSYSHLL